MGFSTLGSDASQEAEEQLSRCLGALPGRKVIFVDECYFDRR